MMDGVGRVKFNNDNNGFPSSIDRAPKYTNIFKENVDIVKGVAMGLAGVVFHKMQKAMEALPKPTSEMTPEQLQKLSQAMNKNTLIAVIAVLFLAIATYIATKTSLFDVIVSKDPVALARGVIQIAFDDAIDESEVGTDAICYYECLLKEVKNKKADSPEQLKKTIRIFLEDQERHVKANTSVCGDALLVIGILLDTLNEELD